MKGAPGKRPTIDWYYKDWLSDRRLQMASASTRGIWMNILMYMIDCSLDGDGCEQGILDGMTALRIQALGSCSLEEADRFIEEALELKFCDISVTGHGDVTIKSRRLKRDAKNRLKARDRKRLQRSKESDMQPKNDYVTQTSRDSHNHTPSPSPSPSPDITKKEQPAAQKRDLKKNGHFEKSVGSFFKSIYESCQKIIQLPKKNGKPFNPYGFTQDFLNQHKHPGAIASALDALSKNWSHIDDPYAYGRSVIKTQNGNFNEKDAIAIHEQLKAMPPADLESITGGILRDLNKEV